MMNFICSCCSSSVSQPVQDRANPRYAPYLQEIFDRHHFNPESLPVLNVGDSLDFINDIDVVEMNQPVMRFTDSRERSGIALHVQQKSTSTREWTVGRNLVNCSVTFGKYNGVLTIHERGLEDRNAFVIGVQSQLRAILNQRHEEEVGHNRAQACPTCPFFDNEMSLSPQILESLFLGTDPDFQLGQDPNFRLFPEQVAVVPPAPVPTFLGWLCEKINTFFMSCLSCFSFFNRNPA